MNTAKTNKGTRITISLNNTKSINDAILQLTATSEKLQAIRDRIVKKMVDTGVESARAKVGVESGALRSSIRGSITSDDKTCVGVISAYSDHAVYHEFGTGVVGKAHSHPEATSVGWAYDVNKHGEAGWTYPKDGGYRHTKGQPARRYMYDTAKELEAKASDIIKEAIHG